MDIPIWLQWVLEICGASYIFIHVCRTIHYLLRNMILDVVFKELNNTGYGYKISKLEDVDNRVMELEKRGKKK